MGLTLRGQTPDLESVDKGTAWTSFDSNESIHRHLPNVRRSYSSVYKGTAVLRSCLQNATSFPASVSDYRIHMSVHKDTVNDEEVQRKSDMHSWGEATAGLCKHGPCGGNDHPVRGHCLPLTLLFGQDSNNHTDLSSFKQVPPPYDKAAAHIC